MIENAQMTLRRLWGQLSWTQRISIVGLAVATVAAVAALVMWASAPSYGVLFSGLQSQDANSIVTQLEADKVPYQLANGGSTILVPQESVDAERLKMAGQGLPQGGVIGFSLFDKSNLFQGDSFTEQINYTRALEGELTNTISQVSGVAYTRVNIVLPQQELFSSQQASPTASVLLKLVPGAALSAGQVGGIQHLVASAVQGLKPDAVTVVDGSGTILSSNDSADTASAAGMSALNAETRYASNLEAQLTAMLDTVVGPDRAVVHVSDTMDWTQRQYTSNTYAPQSSRSPISESHLITDTSSGPGSTVGGIAGLASNVPTYGTKGSTPVSGTAQLSQNQDVVYANSNTVSHIVETPGSIKQLSVAVLLNGVNNAREIAAIRQAIVAGVGLNTKRGDQLSISSVPFDSSVATAAAKADAQQQQQALILSIVRWAALIVVPLILLFLFRRLLVSSKATPPAAEDDLPAVEVIERTEQPALLPAADPVQSEKERQQLLVRQSMAELAREKPEVVAGLIGRWIEEDRG